MPKLCLFDASGYIHRAFHAIPPLTTSKGEPVNAIYGFSRMISKVLKEEKPDYIAVCFDTPQPTFRHEQYVDYKATRVEIDDALLTQLPLAEQLALAWGLPCVKKDGFEADDMIATLAIRGKKAGMDVLILSGDKDILQLVDKNIHVRDELRKVDYDEAKVEERYGFKPSQLVDYLCLMGDKVDNVPGIPGVGGKTAAKLIIAHGSLEGLYANLNGHAPALKEKLLAHRERLFKNRTLIRLRDDVPIDLAFDEMRMHAPDQTVLSALLQKLEFRSGLYGVSEEMSGPALSINKSRKVHTVLTENELRLLGEKLRTVTRLSYDLETNSLNKLRCNIVGVALCVEENESWYIPIGHAYIGAPKQLPWEKVKAHIAPPLEHPKIFKCGQNIKFDNTVLEHHGIRVHGPMFDTMIAAYCIDPARTSFRLKDLAADYLQERMTRIDELIGKGADKDFSFVPIEQAAPYAAADAEVALRLVDLFQEKLMSGHVRDLFEKVEMPLVAVIQEMEAVGIAIDADSLRDVGKKFTGQRKRLEREIFELAGEEFVLNSPKQLSQILFEKLKLPVIKKTKTGFSTDEDVLTKLSADHPICEKIIAARELAKLTSTYVDSLLNLMDATTGRVHTSFHQTGTITGRLSSSEPNLQNIPIRTENGREIRHAFMASPGNVLISADYSQIDLRALAHVSGDPVLIRTFQAGGDVHAATASEMFHVPLLQVTPEMRQSAKAINFGIVYGQQAFALSQSLGISLEVAKDFINKYFGRYAGVRTWILNTLVEARKNLFVSTLAGRRRPVPDINASNAYIRGFAERVAINTPIQGTSADIIKLAMIRVFHNLHQRNLKTRMLVQVHDELLFDCPKTELDVVIPLVRSGMENAFELHVPLLVDIKVGPNWNDMEKIKMKVAA